MITSEHEWIKGFLLNLFSHTVYVWTVQANDELTNIHVQHDDMINNGWDQVYLEKNQGQCYIAT